MITTRRRFLAGLIGSALALPFAGRLWAAPSDPVHIGQQVPLSGFLAPFGKWHHRTAQAAVDQLNGAGGLAGRPIELITIDTTSDPNTAAQLTDTKLLDGPGYQNPVDFVLGSVLSETNIVSAPLAQASRTPYFPQGITTEIAGSQANRWTFKSYHTVQAAIEAGWRWALANLGRRWTIIHSEIDLGLSQGEAWKAKLAEVNGELVDIIPVPFDPSSPPNFSTVFNRLDLTQTEAIFQAFTAQDSLAFFQQAASYGITKQTSLLGLIEGIDVLDVAAAPFDGAYFISGYPRRADQVPAALQTYDADYRQQIGIGSDDYAVDNPSEVVPIADLFGTWQALNLIRVAIETSGWRSRADHPALIRSLEGLPYQAGTGFPEGDGFVRAADHLAFHGHYISQVQGGALRVLTTVPTSESFYTPPVDLTGEPL